MSPIFEYECSMCGNRAEILRLSGSEAPEAVCCKQPMERAISSPSNYQIKGDNSASTRPKGKGSA